MDSLKRLFLGGALAAIWLFVCSFSPLSPLAVETGTIAAAASLPDLAITAVTISPEIPIAGDVLTISVTVQNIGGTASPGCSLACFVDEHLFVTNSLDPLGAGETTTVTINWKSQGGSHVVRAVADSANQITESNKDNNSKSLAFSIGAPDLAIASIAWTPTSPAVGDNVTFTVIMTNLGNQRANSCQLDFTLDGASRGYRTILPLAPGATTSEVYNWVDIPGNHTIGATVDVLERVYDSNRANNHMEVTLATALPDLIISSIAIQSHDATIQYSDLIAGNYIDINVFVQNRGTGLAGPSQVACYVDDSLLGTSWTGYLKQGASENATFLWRLDDAPHTFKAVADFYNMILESDKMNNTRTIPSPSALPDLTISGITWDPSPPIVNQPATFIITVLNQGKAQSPITDLKFGFNTVYQFTSVISELAIGESANITIQYTPLLPNFTANAVIDLDNKIKESNKSNNSKVVNVTATVLTPSADLVVSSLILTPVNPLPRQTITLTLIVKNQGSGSATGSYADVSIDDVKITTLYFDPLDAGATKSTNVSIPLRDLPVKSSYTISVKLDSTSLVAETNEFNNAGELTFSLAASSLGLQGINWSPLVPNQGDVVTFNIAVVNNGAVASTSAKISYYIDDAYTGQHTIDSIAAGGSVTRQFIWQVQKVPFTFTVTIDQGNTSKSVKIPAPDLLIDSFTWTPDTPKELDLVNFTVKLSNRGKGPAPATLLYFYIDNAAPIAFNTPEIGVGGNADVTFTYNFISGEHTLKFVPNGDGAVVESDANNNAKTIKLTVQPLPAAKTAAVTTSPSSANTTQTATTKNASTTTAPKPTTSKSTVTKNTGKNNTAKPSILMNKGLIIGVILLGIAAIGGLLLLKKKQEKTGKSAKSVKAAKPAKPAQSAKSAKPETTDKAAKSGKPAEPVKPVKPPEPSKPAKK